LLIKRKLKYFNIFIFRKQKYKRWIYYKYILIYFDPYYEHLYAYIGFQDDSYKNGDEYIYNDSEEYIDQNIVHHISKF